MPQCSAFGCTMKGGHRFPLNEELKRKWEIALRRERFSSTSSSRVCSAHFNPEDYETEAGFYSGTSKTKKVLKKTAVPSRFVFTNKSEEKFQNASARFCRASKRSKRIFSSDHRTPKRDKIVEAHAEVPEDEHSEVELSEIADFVPDVGNEVECSNSEGILPPPEHDLVNEEPPPAVCSVHTQTYADLGTNILSVERFKHDAVGIKFYTGLENYDKFVLVLNSLGPAAYHLQYRWSAVVNVSVPDQLFMTLMKLKRNYTDYELATFFDVSKSSVANIFVTWINFMFVQWDQVNFWPSRDLIDFYMPQTFKDSFPATRVILDGTEIPITRPTNKKLQQATWSTYKNKNTLKFLVGATPGGLISYLSPAYGGSVSDRQLVERSDLLCLCEEGDMVMADRGFTVQDLFAPKGVSVNIPTFLKGMAQLPGVTLLKDRKLASRRVHIERLIGLSKTYKIMKSEINPFYVPLVLRIYFVCVVLCNFRDNIVNKDF